MEDTFRPDGTKIHGRTAIPFGRFLLDIRQSHKFSKEYLWSDSQKILIRPAERSNFPTINDFRKYYKSLYPKIYPLIKAGNQHINIVRVQLLN